MSGKESVEFICQIKETDSDPFFALACVASRSTWHIPAIAVALGFVHSALPITSHVSLAQRMTYATWKAFGAVPIRT